MKQTAKTIITVLLAVLTAGTACGQNSNTMNRKALVIFFSHAGENYSVGNIAVGNTKIVADYISEITGADQFEIVTEKNYDMPYMDLIKVAQDEAKAGELPAYKGDVDVALYDVIFILGALMMVWAFLSYGKAPLDKAVTGGIYRISRNPMYTSFIIGVIGATVATASLRMLILLVLFVIATHGVILGEERYFAQTYGESYLKDKGSTPRYFLFF